MKINWPIIIGMLVSIVILVSGYFLFTGRTGVQDGNDGQTGQLASFAQCIKDSGATFYGTFWCPHCNDQKEMFGDAASQLPYVECSTPDGRGQLPVCQEQNIQGYPTWEFADGSRETGALTLEQLSERTACPVVRE